MLCRLRLLKQPIQFCNYIVEVVNKTNKKIHSIPQIYALLLSILNEQILFVLVSTRKNLDHTHHMCNIDNRATAEQSAGITISLHVDAHICQRKKKFFLHMVVVSFSDTYTHMYVLRQHYQINVVFLHSQLQNKQFQKKNKCKLLIELSHCI